jgi:eukaryotic-like serine/threonine-protein kinase
MSSAKAAGDQEFMALQSALAGQYSLEREIGRGGMGIVYLAREVQLDRLVAVKVLPPVMGSRPELRERFMREARTAARLSHPNIVPIFRVDAVGDFVFFVMAYIEGETLNQRIRSRGPLPPHIASRVVQEIAWAVAYAHARGVIHRDIKADNILIERESGRALVTDFGIAQVTESHALTEAGQVMGTAHYMSPEQASGEPLDGRSDIYSLGVVAHFALTGQLPFDAPTVQAVLAKHLTQIPAPVSTVAPAVPRALGQAIDRCLAKLPSDRPASGEALAGLIAESAPAKAELPVPLRVWLTRSDPVKPLYVAWSGFFLFFSTMVLLANLFGERASTPSLLIPLLLASLPLLPLGTFRVIQTRRVLGAGYGLDDMRLALEQHVATQREEVAFEDRRPSVGGRILRGISYASLGTAGLVTGMIALPVLPVPAEFALGALGVSAVVGALTAVLGLTYPGRRVRRPVPGEWRLRFWRMRAGEWVTRLAGVRLRREHATHLQRATEVAIGMAAADLYTALPRGVQRQLPEIPGTLRKLEAEAQRMRRKVEELSSRIGEMEVQQRAGGYGESARFGADNAAVASRREEVAAELAAARDAAGKRLSAVVAALENIRLDLLRLQAGGGTGSLTALIESARSIGGEVDDAIRAREEVDRALSTGR